MRGWRDLRETVERDERVVVVNWRDLRWERGERGEKAVVGGWRGQGLERVETVANAALSRDLDQPCGVLLQDKKGRGAEPSDYHAPSNYYAPSSSHPPPRYRLSFPQHTTGTHPRC